MQNWQTLWTFKTARFTVTLDAAPEDMDPADLFCDDADIEAVRSGAVDWFIARVSVLLDGRRIGVYYLGGCAYTNARDFQYESGYFRDMVREAIRDARRTLASEKPVRLRATA